MKIAPAPVTETNGLNTLGEYSIPESLQEAEFNDIACIASEICHTPVSLVSIISANGQSVKSVNEFINPGTSKELALYIRSLSYPDEIFFVPDLSKDDRFCDHPIVKEQPHLKFFAGLELVNSQGNPEGFLCIWDKNPGMLDTNRTNALKSLARQIVAKQELKITEQELRLKNAQLNGAYEDLEKFTYIASHDLKSPLNNIISLTHLLKDGYNTKLDEEGNEYINYLNDAAYQLSDLVSGILSYSKSSQMLVDHKENINVATLIEEVTGLLNIRGNVSIDYRKCHREIYTSKIALKQIFLNLLHNAIKYNDKKHISITINLEEQDHLYTFEVKDNGIGIADEDKERIFKLFEKLNKKRKDRESMGIGLALVKRLVEKLGGEISVVSELSKGATFIFTIPQ